MATVMSGQGFRLSIPEGSYQLSARKSHATCQTMSVHVFSDRSATLQLNCYNGCSTMAEEGDVHVATSATLLRRGGGPIQWRRFIRQGGGTLPPPRRRCRDPARLRD